MVNDPNTRDSNTEPIDLRDAEASGKAPNFDLSEIRADTDAMVEQVGVKVITRVPVRKPNKHAFIRVHPDSEYRVNMHLFQLEGEQEYYCVVPQVVQEFPAQTRLVTLNAAITRAGDVFLWPVPVSDPESRRRGEDWHQSARIAAEHATKSWIRVQANMGLGCYEVIRALDLAAEPVWPDPDEYPFEKLVSIGFDGGRIIRTPDHPVFLELEGRSG